MTERLLGLLVVVWFFTPVWVSAGDGVAEPSRLDQSQYFNIQFENDLFGSGEDSHYTHGSRLSYLTSEQPTHFEEKIKSTVLAPIPKFFIPKTRRISFILGQNIFTPDDIARSDLIENDRPYAGWLYLGAGFVTEGGENVKFMENLEINLGVVGPAALGEEIQTEWHRLIDVKRPKGWDNQLKNEPGLILFYERKLPLRPRSKNWNKLIDFTPSAGFALGNVATYFAAGLTLRIGYNIPNDYGPPRIRPGLSGSGFFTPKSRFTWYVFAGVEGRAVGRNIFLDGNSYQDSHSVDKKTLVGDLQVGFVVTLFHNFRAGFTNVFRTKEFDGQPEEDEFGSINVSYRW
ncbi:MAG: membrane protein [Nitrospinaceae bacterium]|nr:MAG: membrane protein [Nitrospinaceae bacterium]